MPYDTGKVIFDGTTRTITVKSGTAALDVEQDLYSDWKVYAQLEPQFLAAFRNTGGDPLTPGVFLGRYFFLINQWQLVPQSGSTQSLVLNGNIFQDDGLPVVNTSGTFVALWQNQVSSLTTIEQLSGSGGGLTAAQEATLNATYTASGITTSSLNTVLVSQSLADGELTSIITSESVIITSQSLTTGQLDLVISSESIVLASQSLADGKLNASAATESFILVSQSLSATVEARTLASQSIIVGDIDTVLTSQSFSSNSEAKILVSQSIEDSKLDSLLSTSGSGLTPSQADMLLKLYEVLGLDPTKPLVVTPYARTVSTDISQSISKAGDVVTVTRI